MEDRKSISILALACILQITMSLLTCWPTDRGKDQDEERTLVNIIVFSLFLQFKAISKLYFFVPLFISTNALCLYLRFQVHFIYFN